MNSDFSNGKVWKIIIYQSVPLIFAQLVQLLYNVVDRIYIGHMEGVGDLALTGVGLAFPVTTLIAAFTSLFGSGGAPLFSIARGAKDEQQASKILSHVFMLLTLSSIVLFIISFVFKTEILYAFGAGDNSIQYASDYLEIYLFGTTFSMVATGLNNFINAQGFPKIGMFTICIGAVLNMILDPLFIYVFDMGVKGAAIATVISQCASFVWVLYFFTKGMSLYHISFRDMLPDFTLIAKICTLGLAGFFMMATNCAVQITCNKMLKIYGDLEFAGGSDLYIGVMTIINSIREILSLPASGIGGGAQPVLSYNFGARKYSRVKAAIKFASVAGFIYMLAAWLVVEIFPHAVMSVFTNSNTMINDGTPALHSYFFGFFFMAFMFSGQSTFTALGCAKRAVFFSLLRKAIIVIPLTVFLPSVFGVMGVFMAEPISNAIGGISSFITMILTVYKKFPSDDEEAKI